MTQLVMVNRECDLRNKFFDVTDFSEEEIKAITDKYSRDEWFALIREV
jgi:hypothetical protein